MNAAAPDRNPRRCHLMPRDAWLRGRPFAAGRSMSLDAHRRGMLDATGRSTSWNAWCLGTLDAVGHPTLRDDGHHWTLDADWRLLPLSAQCRGMIDVAGCSMSQNVQWGGGALDIKGRTTPKDNWYCGMPDAAGRSLLRDAYAVACLTPRDVWHRRTLDVARLSTSRGTLRCGALDVPESSTSRNVQTLQNAWRREKLDAGRKRSTPRDALMKLRDGNKKIKK